MTCLRRVRRGSCHQWMGREPPFRPVLYHSREFVPVLPGGGKPVPLADRWICGVIAFARGLAVHFEADRLKYRACAPGVHGCRDDGNRASALGKQPCRAPDGLVVGCVDAVDHKPPVADRCERNEPRLVAVTRDHSVADMLDLPRGDEPSSTPGPHQLEPTEQAVRREAIEG